MNVVTVKEYMQLVERVEGLKRACRPFSLDDESRLVGAQGGDFIVRIPSSAFGDLRKALDSLDTTYRIVAPTAEDAAWDDARGAMLEADARRRRGGGA